MSQAAEVLTTPDPSTAAGQLAVVVAPLEPTKAALVRDGFGRMLAKVDEWTKLAETLTVTDETQEGKMRSAHAIRMEIRNARVSLDKKRKEMKESVLREGKAIDGAYAIFEALVKPLEKHLLEQETFVERAVKARQEALSSARRDALLALGVSRAALPSVLGELSEEAWTIVLDDAKAANEARARAAREEEETRKEAERIRAEKRAKEEADRKKADAERVAREEEQRVENDRLKAELEKVEAARKVDEARVEAERQAEREKHAATLAEQRSTSDAREAELAAKTREAEEQREHLASTLRVREQEEARLKEAAEAKTRREAMASDREILEATAPLLRDANLPKLKTVRGQEIVAKIRAKLVKLAADVEEAAKTL